MSGKMITVTLNEEIEEIIKRTKRSMTVDIPAEFIQLYVGALEPLLKTKITCTTAFFIYAVSNMDKENHVYYYKSAVGTFNVYCKKHDHKGFSERSVRAAIDELCVSNRMTKVGSKAFKLNPGFFWKSDQHIRIESFKDYVSLSEDNLAQLGTVEKKQIDE